MVTYEPVGPDSSQLGPNDLPIGYGDMGDNWEPPALLGEVTVVINMADFPLALVESIVTRNVIKFSVFSIMDGNTEPEVENVELTGDEVTYNEFFFEIPITAEVIRIVIHEYDGSIRFSLTTCEELSTSTAASSTQQCADDENPQVLGGEDAVLSANVPAPSFADLSEGQGLTVTAGSQPELTIVPNDKSKSVMELIVAADNVASIIVIVTNEDGVEQEQEIFDNPGPEEPIPINERVNRIKLIFVPADSALPIEIFDLVVEACVKPSVTTTPVPSTTAVCPEDTSPEEIDADDVFFVSNVEGETFDDFTSVDGVTVPSGTTAELSISPDDENDAVMRVTAEFINVLKINVTVIDEEGNTKIVTYLNPESGDEFPINAEVQDVNIKFIPKDPESPVVISQLVVESCVHPVTTTPVPSTTAVCPEDTSPEEIDADDVFFVSNVEGETFDDFTSVDGVTVPSGTTAELSISPDDENDAVMRVTAEFINVLKINVTVIDEEGNTKIVTYLNPESGDEFPINAEVQDVNIKFIPKDPESPVVISQLVVESCVHPVSTTSPATTECCTDWSPWGQCDKQCGEGIQERTRSCLNCDESVVDVQPCLMTPCKCQYTVASLIEQSVPTNNVWYYASVDEQRPVYDGDYIEEGMVIFSGCYECTCDDSAIGCSSVDPECEECEISDWDDWSDCSKDCGMGTKSRSRTVVGEGCDPSLSTVEYDDCNVDWCPEWTPWGPWTDCECDVDTNRMRMRECKKGDEVVDSSFCEGISVESEDCASDPDCVTLTTQPPVCVLPEEVSACSNACPRTCQEFRNPESCVEPEVCITDCRCVDDMVMDDGQCIPVEECGCFHDGIELAIGAVYNSSQCEECTCNENGLIECAPIADCDVNCGWSPWTEPGNCDCDSASSSRYRFPTNPAQQGNGNACEGEDNEDIACQESCTCLIDDVVYPWNETISDEECSYCVCYDGLVCYEKIDANVDGGWTDWTDWSPCTGTCGLSTRKKTRTCMNPATKCAGDPCDGEMEIVEPCQHEEKCCDWEEWSEWSDCSQDCDTGTQTRNREYSQDDCTGMETDSRDCNTDACNMTCIMSEWGIFSPCNVICGMGTRESIRYVVQESDDCPGDLVQIDTCYAGPCICDSEHELWSNFSRCDTTCENRNAQRNVTVCSEPHEGCICEEDYYRDGESDECVSVDVCNQCETIDGVVYDDGDSWTPVQDNCSVCTCLVGQSSCGRICEEFVECKPDEEMVMGGTNNCCAECRPKRVETCELHIVTDYIWDETSECNSTLPVTYTFCSGGCGDSNFQPRLSMTSGTAWKQTCKCCTGAVESYSTVDVVCGLGQEVQQATIAVIGACVCDKCVDTSVRQNEREAAENIP